jgi:hypothetical protein
MCDVGLSNHFSLMHCNVSSLPINFCGNILQVRHNLTRDAYNAMPMFFRLLRQSFLMPAIGQPILKILEDGFQAVGTDDEADLPVLCFQCWDLLAQLFQVTKRAH